jgi:hypothetical protein
LFTLLEINMCDVKIKNQVIILGVALASPLLFAQDGVPDDVIVFCDGIQDGASGLVDFEVASNGNMYAFPLLEGNVTGGPGFTYVIYENEQVAPVFNRVMLSELTSANAAVVFAGHDELLYSNNGSENNMGIRTGVVITYDVSQSGTLVESSRIYPPFLEDIVETTDRVVIDAEQDQFVIESHTDGPFESKVFIYRKSNGSWDLDGELTFPNDTVKSLAIDGDSLLCSLFGNGDSVRLYTRGAAGWGYKQEIVPFDYMNVVNLEALGDFGYSCDMKNGRVVIGDPERKIYDANLEEDQTSGACFVYSFANDILSEEMVLFEHDGSDRSSADHRRYGISLDLSEDGGYLAVGAPNFDLGPDEFTNTGAAFLYNLSNPSVPGVKYFDAVSIDGQESFGKIVDIAGGALSVWESVYYPDSSECSGSLLAKPAVLLYTDAINLPQCSAADFAEPYGALNFLDVSAFLAAFGAQDPAADINADSSFNFLDVSEYLALYAAGCP